MPAPGVRRSPSCSRMPATTSRCGHGARSCARRSTRSVRTPTTCRASSCPTRCRPRTTPRRRSTRRRRCSSRCRRRRFRDNLDAVDRPAARDALLVSLMKGVELGSLKRMSEVIAEVTGAGPERIGVVSGPNLAKEIASREPAASVVACADEVNVKRLRALCHSATFRPYSSTDVVGCELGGAYKNVIALAVGMAVGLGFGDNTTASVITRGLAETARLAASFGRRPDDPHGPRRARRPGGHLLLTAVAQPHLRREARPRHDHRGDHCVDAPGGRGREVLRRPCWRWPSGPTSTHRSWRPCTRSSRAR